MRAVAKRLDDDILVDKRRALSLRARRVMSCRAVHTLRLSTDSLLVSCTTPVTPELPNSGNENVGGNGGRALPDSLQERLRLPCSGTEGMRAASWSSGTELLEKREGRCGICAAVEGSCIACLWLQNGLLVSSATSPPSVMVCKLGDEPWRGSEGAGPVRADDGCCMSGYRACCRAHAATSVTCLLLLLVVSVYKGCCMQCNVNNADARCAVCVAGVDNERWLGAPATYGCSLLKHILPVLLRILLNTG